MCLQQSPRKEQEPRSSRVSDGTVAIEISQNRVDIEEEQEDKQQSRMMEDVRRGNIPQQAEQRRTELRVDDVPEMTELDWPPGWDQWSEKEKEQQPKNTTINITPKQLQLQISHAVAAALKVDKKKERRRQKKMIPLSDSLVEEVPSIATLLKRDKMLMRKRHHEDSESSSDDSMEYSPAEGEKAKLSSGTPVMVAQAASVARHREGK